MVKRDRESGGGERKGTGIISDGNNKRDREREIESESDRNRGGKKAMTT